MTGQRFFDVLKDDRPITSWTVDSVGKVLVEALRMHERIYRSKTPTGGYSAWPAILREWEDILNQVGAGETFRDRNAPRLALTADQVSRVEQVVEWQTRYLRLQPGPARVLSLWLLCKVRRWKFKDAIRRAGIAPSTAYWARDRALRLIAEGLIRDGVEPFGMGRSR